ncbi:hypothetical protein [Streptomyces glomeratus]|uniref:hypothetical protein n=1 Tax=Streptomyces glomeratus TaxID=284452 RepID=UPI001F34BF26|nr:hypothetical protein [Streptomyces glomeratus]MCF1506659.1 hypothetical protein [Streptomyces glomeratus]
MNERNDEEPRPPRAGPIAVAVAGALLTAGLSWAVVWWGLGRYLPGFWLLKMKLSVKGGVLVMVGLLGAAAWIRDRFR